MQPELGDNSNYSRGDAEDGRAQKEIAKREPLGSLTVVLFHPQATDGERRNDRL
jgi:hypothetical protein